MCNIAQRKHILDGTGPDKVSIYIRIPFCPHKMPLLLLYIEFRQKIYFLKNYIEALKKEIFGVGEILNAKGFKSEYLYGWRNTHRY